jgi:hypothetical protein
VVSGSEVVADARRQLALALITVSLFSQRSIVDALSSPFKIATVAAITDATTTPIAVKIGATRTSDILET